jgi:hypothetical protein
MAILMATKIEHLEAFWEKWHPIFLGACTALLAAWQMPRAFGIMEAANWDVGTIYSSTFDVASVATPFLFTFYTIFVTTESGFIGRMRRTKAYADTISYTLKALRYGACLIAASLPFMLVVPKPTLHSDAWNFAVAAWAGLAVCTILAFVRAARQFSIFISAQR